jgi:hypothetical protein
MRLSSSAAYEFQLDRNGAEDGNARVRKVRPFFSPQHLDNIPSAWLRFVEPHVVRGAFLPCWIWTGNIDEWGYPRLHFRDPSTGKSKYIFVHRLVVQMFWDVPQHWYVKRSCNTVNCVNPHHLIPTLCHPSKSRS